MIPRSEYEERWSRVCRAMRGAGHDWLVVWQRGAGGYDRIGDVFWLTGFAMIGSGQDPASEEEGAPYTFCAVLIDARGSVELHVGLPPAEMDPSAVACTRLVAHGGNLMAGLAAHLRERGIAGRVAIVGDDTLPGLYDRLLRRLTPQIEWEPDERLLLRAQRVKSALELESFRRAGQLVTRALDAMMNSLRAGESGAEAAAVAAAELIRGGGGFHRIDAHYGPSLNGNVLNPTLYGYTTERPKHGGLVRAWIFGPIFDGYWLDPGRSAVAAARPTPAQRSLLEGAVDVVDSVLQVMRPGVTPRELGRLGAEVARRHGYFDVPQLPVPLLGHGLGTNFIPNLIPLGGDSPDPGGTFEFDVPLEPGMIMTAEIFLTHPGVGSVGFEQNVIVTSQDVELLTRTPMLFD